MAPNRSEEDSDSNNNKKNINIYVYTDRSKLSPKAKLMKGAVHECKKFLNLLYPLESRSYQFWLQFRMHQADLELFNGCLDWHSQRGQQVIEVTEHAQYSRLVGLKRSHRFGNYDVVKVQIHFLKQSELQYVCVLRHHLLH